MPRTNLEDSSPAYGGGGERGEPEGALLGALMPPPSCFAWSPSPAERGRNQPARANSRNRQLVAIAAALLFAVALAGCGKKGAPQPPPDEPNTFPRSYPNV